MKSIALWYEEKKGHTPNKNIELHINWGKLPKTFCQTIRSGCSWDKKYPFRRVPGFTRFIDFGLMIEDYENIEFIKFYFPFDFKDSDFQDLGEVIKEVETLSALFNKNYTVQRSTNLNLYPVAEIDEENNQNFTFSVYSLKHEFKIEKPENAEGTILTLTMPEHEENQPNKLYIRFRLKGKPIRRFCYSEPLSFAFIQSAFSKASMIDFRMNDLREIDTKIIEHTVNSKKFFNFTTVHFLFIGTSRDENVFFDQKSVNCRLLEENRWSKYLEGLAYDNGRKVLAYYWISDKVVKNFNILLKTNSTYIKIKDLLVYLLVVILIGIVINIFSSICINSFFGNKNTEIVNSCKCNEQDV